MSERAGGLCTELGMTGLATAEIVLINCRRYAGCSNQLHTCGCVRADDTDFEVFIAPWPNYFSLGPNFQLYAEHGVSGLFAEGGGNLAEDMGDELVVLTKHQPCTETAHPKLTLTIRMRVCPGAMKQYMLSKMMWNVSLAAEWESLMADFLDGYYGAAAPHIHAYMQLMHTASMQAGALPRPMLSCVDQRAPLNCLTALHDSLCLQAMQ